MADMQSIFHTVDTLSSEEQDALLHYLQEKSLNDTPPVRILGLHAHLGTAWTSEDFDEELSFEGLL